MVGETPGHEELYERLAASFNTRKTAAPNIKERQGSLTELPIVCPSALGSPEAGSRRNPTTLAKRNNEAQREDQFGCRLTLRK